MQIMRLTPETFDACVVAAAASLKAGGVILFPTDTLYGLGTNALSDECVAKIYAIKGRPDGKPIHAIVSDADMARQYGELDEAADRIAGAFFPGPLTLIVNKKHEYTAGVMKDIPTFGFRVPKQDFCLAVAKAADMPFTATSANKSGQVPQRSLGAILAQLGPAISLIEIAFDAGELPESPPSTVVDVSKGRVEILREGAIPATEILKA